MATVRVTFSETFDSPRYGLCEKGKSKEVSAADAEAFERDGRIETKKADTKKKEVT